MPYYQNSLGSVYRVMLS